MREVTGDLWDYHDKGAWVVVTTNMQRNKYGYAIMGAGIAQQAARRFPALTTWYGSSLDSGISRVVYPELRVVLLPTKDQWYNPSKLQLVEEGVRWLVNTVAVNYPKAYFGLPRLGCGLGKLNWEADVKPLLERHLTSDRYVVVQPGG